MRLDSLGDTDDEQMIEVARGFERVGKGLETGMRECYSGMILLSEEIGREGWMALEMGFGLESMGQQWRLKQFPGKQTCLVPDARRQAPGMEVCHSRRQSLWYAIRPSSCSPEGL